MWLFLPFGFFSVVMKDGDMRLTVRARVRSDLDELRRRYLPSLTPTIALKHTDYQYRSTVLHADLAKALVAIVADLDYDNFKSTVEREQGHEREQVYGRVCGVLAAGLPPLDTQHERAQRAVVMPRVLRSRPRKTPRRR